MSRRPNGVPLKALIVDADEAAARTLADALGAEPSVLTVESASSLAEEGDRPLEASQVNTIFIDPLSLGLDAASDFILRVRETFPEIVFVLYVDKADVEEHRSKFYRGERRRFAHYYSLDKRTPVAAFPQELRAILASCQAYLRARVSASSLARLREEAERLGKAGSKEERGLLKEVGEILTQLTPEQGEKERTQPNTVFVSHRFAEEEYVTGLCKLLRQNGFEPVTGKSANTYVSKAVLDRIKESEFFLCLMTRDQEKHDGTFTTSAWLLEEKGAALAFGKALVLMVEEGVTDFGGLQGDWQRIPFGPKGFLNAAFEAVDQLKSYAGG
jgi:hypothetical protein